MTSLKYSPLGNVINRDFSLLTIAADTSLTQVQTKAGNKFAIVRFSADDAKYDSTISNRSFGDTARSTHSRILFLFVSRFIPRFIPCALREDSTLAHSRAFAGIFCCFPVFRRRDKYILFDGLTYSTRGYFESCKAFCEQ